MKKLLLILLCLLSFNSLFPQQFDRVNYSRLDSRLSLYIHEKQTNPKLVKLPMITSGSGDQNVIGVIIRTDDPTEIVNNGIAYNSKYNGFVTARVTVDDIIKLSNLQSVRSIRLGQEFYPKNDVSGGLIGSKLLNAGLVNNTQYNGQNVIILIIDSGIDWSHFDFRNTTNFTKSRILYIWDQTLNAKGSEKTPQGRDAVNYSGLNYGVEYSQSDINNELVSSPHFVRETDSVGHGSHVTGSAAGNGASMTNKKYAGIAPQADIVMVKAGNGSFTNTNLIDGLSYAAKIADQFGRPVVVNMSLGGLSGPHDGTSDEEKAIDQFTSGGPGRVAVVAAGNDGDNNIHISGSIANGATANISFLIPSYKSGGVNNDFFGFDFWSNSSGNLSATVTSPNNYSVTQQMDTQGITQTNDGTVFLYNYVDSNNNNREELLEVYDSIAAFTPAIGAWNLYVTNNSGSAVTYHGWLFGSSMGAILNGGNSQYTVGSPGTSTNAITVGAFTSRWRWQSINKNFYSYVGTETSDNIASFSSIGPRRDGVLKPEITAPGEGVVSVKSSFLSQTSTWITPDGLHMVDQGTSMATPITVGAVALLLQQNPGLTYSQVKTYLTNNAYVDNYVGTAPNNQWGYGKLNVFKAMVNLVNGSAPNNYSILAYDQWTSTLGVNISPNQKIAVKFTPTFTGLVSGAFVHLYTSNGTTSPLYFEIWSDISGLPGSKLGSTVPVDQNSFLLFSWNYIDLSSAGVNVTSGTNYHIVAYFSSGTTVGFSINNGALANRSFINLGSSWTSYSSDFRIRPLVISGQSNLSLSSINLILKSNWNIISAPFLATDMTTSTLFPDFNSLTYSYADGYNTVTTLQTGMGYWLKYSKDTTLVLSGNKVNITTVPVKNGWNIIGPYDWPVPVSGITTTPNGILNSQFYEYDNGYIIPSSLSPGNGYWIKVTSDGTLNFPAASASSESLAGINKSTNIVQQDGIIINVSDAKGNNGILSLIKETGTLAKYNLPPTPPNGIFDVRWNSDRNVETRGTGIKELEINSANYPVTITVTGGDVKIKDIVNGQIVNQIVKKSGSVSITNRSINRLSIEDIEIPTEFRLLQNYPNPFNPETKIEYWLPASGKVSLKIYDILGREVETLVDQNQDAGKYEVNWKATNYGSGVYFYNIIAGSNHSVKKMLLVK